MSRRFGRNQRRRAREEVAKADRRTEYWIERARAAEAREGALARRLRNAIEVEVNVHRRPIDRISDCEAVATYRGDERRVRVSVDDFRVAIESRETQLKLVRTVARCLIEKLEWEGRRG